mmetsp:Transcript_68635/g.114059  ORF Transcript_68635/g.114059 Transcript_68635/m.114059 type:complete len:338 (-) Transcript_68635:214-1227(-)
MVSLSSPHLFIAGLGYVGLHIACAARDAGWRVSGSCRACKVELFRDMGVSAHIFDLDDACSGLSSNGLAALADATHVMATVPPIADLDRDPLLSLHRSVLLNSPNLRWAGYLSTTGVYGDHGGAWVDERSETRAAIGSKAAARLEAEREWLALREASGGKLASHIFRLAGIYGPGRSALHTIMKRQRVEAAHRVVDRSTDAPLPLESSAPKPSPQPATPQYVSRIHIVDIANAVFASMSAPSTSAVDATYNLCDNEPATRAEVWAYAKLLLGKSAYGIVDDDVVRGERARRRHRESKRVDNRKMREELLPAGLHFPTYREGLRELHRKGDAAFYPTR